MKIGIVVATVVGIVVGVLGMVLLGDQNMESIAVEDVRSDLSSGDSMDGAMNDELIQLRAAHETLEAELASTRLELESVLSAADSAPQQASVAQESIMEQLGEEIEDAALREMTERRAEWTQRREEWGNEFRTRTETFFSDAVANSVDPVEQERLLAMQDYLGAMQDLRQQMGEATTEAAEETIREAMRENGDAMQSLVKEQQQHILSQVASEYGVTKPREQRQLAGAMQEAMESPFFWGGRMFGGGYGGGRGGPGGRGGGR